MRPSILIAAICQIACPAIQAAGVGLDDRGSELISKYLKASQIRQAAMRGVEMETDIHAKLPKLMKASTLRALRRVSCTGQVTYKAVDSSGDARVKKEVISRYLAAETEARDPDSIAITPANYEFRLKAALGPDGRQVRIFRLKPRKKRIGLFKGELWLDAETGMPLREAGQFVKVSSIFLKRIRFVRDYEIRGGVSVPKSIESTVETRLMGRVELSVHFHNFTYQESGGCDPRMCLGFTALFVMFKGI